MSKPMGDPADTTPPAYTQQPVPENVHAGADGGGYYPPAGQAPQQYPTAPQQYPPVAGQAQYPPVTGQPTSGQHIIGQPVSGQHIIGQPVSGQHVIGQPVAKPYAQNFREWDTQLLGCAEDAAVCVYGYFCSWCMVCGIMEEMGESQCYACLMPGAALHSARTKLRLNYGINGTLFGDQCATFCCFSCAACQIKRQMKLYKTQQEMISQIPGPRV